MVRGIKIEKNLSTKYHKQAKPTINANAVFSDPETTRHRTEKKNFVFFVDIVIESLQNVKAENNRR